VDELKQFKQFVASISILTRRFRKRSTGSFWPYQGTWPLS